MVFVHEAWCMPLDNTGFSCEKRCGRSSLHQALPHHPSTCKGDSCVILQFDDSKNTPPHVP